MKTNKKGEKVLTQAAVNVYKSDEDYVYVLSLIHISNLFKRGY